MIYKYHKGKMDKAEEKEARYGACTVVFCLLKDKTHPNNDFFFDLICI